MLRMTTTGEKFEKLVGIIKRLRDPNAGCPWDLEQTHKTLKPYLIEESYETLDAIDNHPDKLKEELGDVLLQVMLHSQIGADEKTFTIDDVVEILSEKLVKRHPHVFGTTKVDGTKQVLENWEKIKKKDRKNEESILDGIPAGMPALLRAHRIGEKVGRVGFDWIESEHIEEKIREELNEFLESTERDHTEEEFGDLLFTIAQLGRKLKLPTEEILQRANQKFTRRFKALEQKAGCDLKSLPRERLEELWASVKLEEA